MDLGGNVVGIIDMSRRAVSLVRNATVDEEHLNFATIGTSAANFLERQNISYQTASPVQPLATSDLVARIKTFTVAIQCRTNF